MALRIKTSDSRNGPLRYWQAMVDLTRERGSFSLADIHGLQNGRKVNAIKRYIFACCGIGAVQVVATETRPNGWPSNRYRVVVLTAPAPVIRRDTYSADRGRRIQCLWNAMRQLRVFSVAEIHLAASTEEVAVTDKMARYYVLELGRAGILHQVRRANPRIGAPAIWRLTPARNSGPRAPSVTKDGVFDRNLQRIVNVTGEASVNHGRAA